jgi:hypothetical protein
MATSILGEVKLFSTNFYKELAAPLNQKYALKLVVIVWASSAVALFALKNASKTITDDDSKKAVATAKKSSMATLIIVSIALAWMMMNIYRFNESKASASIGSPSSDAFKQRVASAALNLRQALQQSSSQYRRPGSSCACSRPDEKTASASARNASAAIQSFINTYG